MFFSDADACEYAPNASVDNGVIYRAQLEAEGPRGANRALEKEERTESVKTNSTRLGTAQLTFTPIDLTLPITIRVRSGNFRNQLNRAIPLSNWTTLTDDDFDLTEDGKLSLNIGSNIGSNYGLGYRNKQPRITTEIEATYTGGLDFTVTNNPQVEALKYALGAVIEYQQSKAYAGVIEVDVKNQFKERYATPSTNSADAQRVPDALLIPFVRYRSVGA